MLTREQLAQRRQGITATDVAKILGVHPYAGPADVQADKLGQAPEFEDNDRARWGRELEPLLREDYGRRRGLNMLDPDLLGTLSHSDNPRHMATPDSVAVSQQRQSEHWRYSEWPSRPYWTHGWEGKTHTWRLADEYGPAGTDEVPLYERFQCAWNMHVSGLDRWDLTLFMDGLPTDYTIRRDLELEGQLADVVDRFWSDHIDGRQPLPPDGSEAFNRYLIRSYPKNTTDDLLVATEEDLALLAELRSIRRDLATIGKRKGEIEQWIKARIGEASGIEFPALTPDRKGKERVTWRLAKDSERVDWEQVARSRQTQIELLASTIDSRTRRDKLRSIANELVESMADQVKSATRTTPGTRRFSVPQLWTKELKK